MKLTLTEAIWLKHAASLILCFEICTWSHRLSILTHHAFILTLHEVQNKKAVWNTATVLPSAKTESLHKTKSTANSWPYRNNLILQKKYTLRPQEF